MACADFQELLVSHALGELPEPERERVRTHLAECRPCRNEHRLLCQTVGAVQLPALSTSDLEALEGLSRRIHAQRSTAAPRSAWALKLSGALAAAAVAAFVVVPRGHAPDRPGETGSSFVEEAEAWASAGPVIEEADWAPGFEADERWPQRAGDEP